MSDVLVRPMQPDDVVVAEGLSDEAFLHSDRAQFRRSWPDPEPRAATHSENWVLRTQHFLATDAGGCWVAECAGDMIGFATSIRRDGTWILATFAVRPGLQGRGIGAQLLAAALTHSQGCLRGMLSSSSDVKAVRRYLLAGFTMHPQMFLRGTVDRSVIPVVQKVREGSASDIDLLDSVDRHARGAGHGVDHAFMTASWHLQVSDTTTGSGYVYASAPGRVDLLAATNRRTAARLLWAALADAPGEVTVPHLTAANAWAIEVGTAARLDLHQEGFLALRGMRPPSPYIHNGAML
ncbi:MAG: GNAT family N-acetyltransferase [Nocardioides sp.]